VCTLIEGIEEAEEPIFYLACRECRKHREFGQQAKKIKKSLEGHLFTFSMIN
jgi:hypothetical protein